MAGGGRPADPVAAFLQQRPVDRISFTLESQARRIFETRVVGLRSHARRRPGCLRRKASRVARPAPVRRPRAPTHKISPPSASSSLSLQPLPGINGKLTMSENIADLGGLTLALDAYHASLHGKPAPVIDVLIGDRRVFLGWAQAWCGKLTDDPHSPRAFRVNGRVLF